MNNDDTPGQALRRRSLLGLAAALGLGAPGAAMTAPDDTTFTNPVLPGVEAGDPFVVWHEGRYYLTATFDPEGGLWVYSSDHLSDWRHAERRKVFKDPMPASTHVLVTRLVGDDWLVEIEATAFVPRR